jgi:hypothetical protein
VKAEQSAGGPVIGPTNELRATFVRAMPACDVSNAAESVRPTRFHIRRPPDPNGRRCTPVADITNNTIDGLLAYCDWLVEKGYGTSSQIEPWKTAVKKVFYTVDGEDYGPSALDNIDLDDYFSRFRKLAAGQYKHESMTAYEARVRRAIEAHAHFLEHGRPPTFRQVTKRTNGDAEAASGTKPKTAKPAKVAVPTPTGPEFFDLEYPLESGSMALLRLPKRMSKTDVDRLSTVLRTLQVEEQKQIAERTGEDVLAA